MKGFGIQLIDNTNEGEIYDLQIKVKKDSEGKIVSGLCLGSTLEQNKALILIQRPGEQKQYPRLGVGIEDVLLGADLLEFRHSIRSNFEQDGLKTTKLDLYKLDKIDIVATY